MCLDHKIVVAGLVHLKGCRISVHYFVLTVQGYGIQRILTDLERNVNGHRLQDLLLVLNTADDNVRSDLVQHEADFLGGFISKFIYCGYFQCMRAIRQGCGSVINDTVQIDGHITYRQILNETVLIDIPDKLVQGHSIVTRQVSDLRSRLVDGEMHGLCGLVARLIL